MAALDDACEGLLGEAIALAKAVGYKGVCVGAQVTQAQGEQAGGAHAVHVEVAEDGNGLAARDCQLKAVCGLGHAGNEQRIAPVALERGREEGASLLYLHKAARDQHTSHQRRDGKRLDEPPLGFAVS